MADHDRDDELSRRYRELAREEPARASDDAILAAARRAVEARPAPLVAPTGRRRWFVPVAAAAVIVLSAVVTLNVQREQPDIESTPQYAPPAAARKDEAAPIPPRAEMKEERQHPQPKEAEAPRDQVEALTKPESPQRARQKPPAPPAGEPQLAAKAATEAKPQANGERFTPDPAPVATAPAAAPPPPAPAPAPVQAPQMQMQQPAAATRPAPRAEDSAGVAAGAAPPAGASERRSTGALRDGPRQDSSSMLYKREIEPPEKILERIATLRREGRAKEADDLYAEFKRRYPDYRIPDALREQVLPR